MGNLRLWGEDATGKRRFLAAGDTPSDEAGNSITSISGRLQHYLGAPVFKVVSGNPTCDELYPDFAVDGESLAFVKGYVFGDVGHIAWPGRLASDQTTIKSIKIGIKGPAGSPDYKLRVYVEGAGVFTLAYDSGSLVAGAYAETTVLAAALSAQPINKKRYHVVVEAYLDVTEFLYASRPFADQE